MQNLKKYGYAIPDKGAHGKTMMPDGSVGKLVRSLHERE